jgi:hypothetical protein
MQDSDDEVNGKDDEVDDSEEEVVGERMLSFGSDKIISDLTWLSSENQKYT